MLAFIITSGCVGYFLLGITTYALMFRWMVPKEVEENRRRNDDFIENHIGSIFAGLFWPAVLAAFIVLKVVHKSAKYSISILDNLTERKEAKEE